MSFKSLDCVMVVCCRENDNGRGVERDLAKNAETVDLGHLDVEEGKIRLVLPDGGDRLKAIPTLGDNLDVTFR